MSRKHRLRKHSAVVALFIIKLWHIGKKLMSRRKNLSVKPTVTITATGN